MANVHLDIEFRRVLANLAVPEGASNGARGVSPEEQQILVRELERTLVHPPCLAAYLDVVRPLARPSAADLDLLTDEQVEQVVTRGLGSLPFEQVRQLAFDLPTLLALRDRITEELPTSVYWCRLTKEEAARRGTLRSARELLADQPDAVCRLTARAEEAQASAGPNLIEAAREPRRGKVWGIKLGSGGAHVAFCERHSIVGVGWKEVDPGLVATGTRDELWSHVKAVCTWYEGNRMEVGKATGQLIRFGQECKEGDYVLYYNPPGKCVRVCRVVSGPLYRGFEPGDVANVWHYRKVEYPVGPIPVLDLHGTLKGSLLGPRMAFWSMGEVFETVDQLARGESPRLAAAPDPELAEAYRHLQGLVIRRAEALNDQDWEWLVVDYLKAQGASVDERLVGGNRPIIDAEAVFDHGELGREVWRVQVKRYQGRPVDWPEVEHDYRNVGDANFCFVSVFGFTDQARQKADQEGIRLMEAGDFVLFLLGGKLRPRLRDKLRLTSWAS
jgi:predicted Mrr-cat superfamily restriction endonuclease